MVEDDLLTRYYLDQAGSGMGEFYSGPIYQRGNGIGSYLSGLFRRVLPVLKRRSIAAGKEILNSGAKFMSDMEKNKKPHDAFNERARETLGNLKRIAMYGEGFKTAKYPKKRQLKPTKRRVHTKSRKIGKKKKNKKKLI